MRATERLAKRLESERHRNERFKERQKSDGKRQVMLWLSDDDVEAADRLKAAMGVTNRSEVISTLLRNSQPQAHVDTAA